MAGRTREGALWTDPMLLNVEWPPGDVGVENGLVSTCGSRIAVDICGPF